MELFPLSPYKKGSFTLYPQSSSYSDEYASRMCPWYLTNHIYEDERGNLQHCYRLHSNEPRAFAEFMAYDIMCPKCRQRMHPIGNALNHYDLALYSCRNCTTNK